MSAYRFRNVRAVATRVRWSALITARRAANRWWDAVGYTAGFCMQTTWQGERATYRPGRKHWRCWVLRKDHTGRLHRAGAYRWPTGGQPIYDPPPFSLLRKPGVAPRWLQGRHFDVGTRRRDRMELRAEFERVRASGRARLARGGASMREALEAAGEIAGEIRREAHDRGETLGELGVLPFTGDLTDAERADLGEPMRAMGDVVRELVRAETEVIERAVEQAVQGGKHGVMVVRGPGATLRAGVDESVPYGEVHEHRVDRHDWHVHGPRPGLDPEHWDENGKLRP